MLKSTNLLTSHPLSIRPLVQTSSGLINAFPTPNIVPVINALLQTTTTSAASASTASDILASDVLDLVETRISDKSQNIKLRNLRRSSTTEINILKREFCDDLQQAVRSSVALLDSTLDSARSAANDGDAVPKKLRKKFKSEAEEAAKNLASATEGVDFGVNAAAAEDLERRARELNARLIECMGSSSAKAVADFSFEKERSLEKLERLAREIDQGFDVWFDLSSVVYSLRESALMLKHFKEKCEHWVDAYFAPVIIFPAAEDENEKDQGGRVADDVKHKNTATWRFAFKCVVCFYGGFKSREYVAECLKKIEAKGGREGREMAKWLEIRGVHA
ncbi:hypothetical protein TrVE_jg468 [Triparma verrucosa]|uniref:Uncharacterized protein n=1 Tax=Triparma verrucosa TaxID=1606542 RepID=A0A9W7F2N3_9STRA|nr:hypothetical protein TrVE_jg468 [Triparma verrucosa]